MQIELKDVRSALVDLDFMTQEEVNEFSDEQLLQQDFQNDLALDSLDFLLLLERLEGPAEISLMDVGVWDCQTVQDLLNASRI